jgi:hypothetical protein
MADADDPTDGLNPEGIAPEVNAEIEELKAKAAKADEYKLYADRMAAENKRLKKEKPTNEGDPTPADERFDRLDLKTDGYSAEEVDFIMANGGRPALGSKLVQAAIDSQRKAAKSEEATPPGTGRSPVYQKYTEKDLSRMPLEELEKIIPQD